MVLIGIIGKKYSGKDTIADYLVANHNFKKMAFADPVKKITKELFNFSDEQLYGNLKETVDTRWGISPREAFQKIGTEFGQFGIHTYFPSMERFGRSLWVERLFAEYIRDENTVISDVRFKHEIDRIKKENGIIIKIIRDNNYIDNHISENEIDTEECKIFFNNGTKDELYNSVEQFINQLNYDSLNNLTI
jgi:hypothetical protein